MEKEYVDIETGKMIQLLSDASEVMDAIKSGRGSAEIGYRFGVFHTGFLQHIIPLIRKGKGLDNLPFIP